MTRGPSKRPRGQSGRPPLSEAAHVDRPLSRAVPGRRATRHSRLLYNSPDRGGRRGRPFSSVCRTNAAVGLPSPGRLAADSVLAQSAMDRIVPTHDLAADSRHGWAASFCALSLHLLPAEGPFGTSAGSYLPFNTYPGATRAGTSPEPPF